MLDKHNTCGECKHTVPFPHLPNKTEEEILLMCTRKDSRYYKVCKCTMACDKFSAQ